MSRTIVVSDLHVDSWSKDAKIAGADGRKLTMLDYFNEFLDWCVDKRGVDRFIIAGDLMDSPADPNCNLFTCANPTGKLVLARLEKLAKQIQVTYVVGNHDIGLNELSYLGVQTPPLMPSVSMCYPGCTVDTYAGGAVDTDTGRMEKTSIMINHGHFCDPALVLYENDLVQSMYFRGSTDPASWPHLGAIVKPAEPRLLGSAAMAPITIGEGETAYQAARAGQDATPPAAGTPWSHGGWLDKPTQEIRRKWWWGKGLDAMEAYVHAQGHALTRVYLIQGHTHLMDDRDPVQRAGVACCYINAGTWEEGYGSANYIDIDASGHCWLQDWIKEPLTTKEKAPRHPL